MLYNKRDTKPYPRDAVYIGRPSPWGNPFEIGVDGDRITVIRKYLDWVQSQPELIARIKRELRGKHLLCWCCPKECHGDVLHAIANDLPLPDYLSLARPTSGQTLDLFEVSR